VSRRLLAAVSVLAISVAGCDTERAGLTPEAAERAAERSVEIARRYGVEALPLDGLELTTPFSRIRLRDAALLRSMFFVRDDGTPMLQTRLNLAVPHLLTVPYTRTMFASYLFQAAPTSVLIVGLGGGAMVRYLENRDPELEIDAVDIDPEVVRIADRYFGTRSSAHVRIEVADGYQVIRSGTGPYDVIYMDAFLRPSDETDSSGNPLRLKETPFYQALRSRLSPTGVAVFNLNPQPDRESDIVELRGAFPQLYVFHCDGDLNWVAVATLETSRRTAFELAQTASTMRPAFDGDLDFAGMVNHLQEPPA
jgi:spermidine synthase